MISFRRVFRRNPGNSEEYPEFRKMRPGRNQNKKRNAHVENDQYEGEQPVEEVHDHPTREEGRAYRMMFDRTRSAF